MSDNATDPCGYCGSRDWELSSPSYGGGPAQYAHHCSRTGSRLTRMVGGGRYLGGGRYSIGPDSDEPEPDLPTGYYAQRRETLIASALATHAADCGCMACAVGRKEVSNG